MNEQKKARNSDRSHSKPWHADQLKHHKAINTVTEEEPRDSWHHSNRGRSERESIATKDTAVMRDTTVTSGTTAVEERAAAERRSRFVSSMAKIKAIG